MTKPSLAEVVNNRRLIQGPRNDLMAVYPLKHSWAWDVYKVMLANHWIPDEVSLVNDSECYNYRLNDNERTAYNRALAFLSNLDGIQFNNINMNIIGHVTSPEVEMCLSRQAFEETLHVRSYAQMIEAITDDPESIYGMFETDEILAKKNDFILKQSRMLGEDFSPHGFALAIVSNVMLEGLYFFTGFLTFYLLAREGKMLGSADMIRYIQRDEEQAHLTLFRLMLNTMRQENPEVFTPAWEQDAVAIIKESQALESAWGKYVNGTLTGCSETMIELYTQYLANLRAEQMGLPLPFEPVENPFSWVAEYTRLNALEMNFFEGKVTDYRAGALDGLDEL